MYFTFHRFLLKRIVGDVRIEAIASHQAGVVVQSLFCNTAFLSWSTEVDPLLERKYSLLKLKSQSLRLPLCDCPLL